MPPHDRATCTTRRIYMRRLLPAAFAVALWFAPSSLLAQVELGPQLSYGTDNAGLALGGRLIWVWPWEPGTSTIASFDYFFPDGDFDLWEININLAHSIPVKIEDTEIYAGAGLNWAHFSWRDRNDDRFGLNLLAGFKYMLPSVTPYGEVRAELGGGEIWVFTGGVMFNVGAG
jgi:hypothetical protein